MVLCVLIGSYSVSEIPSRVELHPLQGYQTDGSFFYVCVSKSESCQFGSKRESDLFTATRR
jgi:hypothetical protein